MTSVPADWRDREVVVGALFSPFRSREVNPVGYDSKMAFWHSHLSELCRSGRRALLSRRRLEAELVVGHHRPSCLQQVFDNMRVTGEALTPAELQWRAEAAQSWSSWTADALLWRPARTAYTWVKHAIWAPEPQEDIVLLAPLKDLADALYQRHLELVAAGRCNAFLSVDALCALHAALVADRRQMEMVLLELWRRGDVTLTETDGRPAVKFRLEGEARRPAVTELDRGLQRLAVVEQRLTEQVATMERQMQTVRETAKTMLKNNQHELAKKQYRQWKRSQVLLEKRLNTLNNVQAMLQNIEQSKNNRQVLDALSRGTAAVKGAFGDVTLDKVDQVVTDCQESLDEQQEMQEALSRPLLPGEAADTAQLEAELAQLLSGTGAQQTDVAPARPLPAELDLPNPPSESPGRISEKALPKPAGTALHA